MSCSCEVGTTIMLGILILILLATALRAVTKGGDPVGPGCSARELWRVLFGGAASLFALLLCLMQWRLTHLFWQHDMDPLPPLASSGGTSAPCVAPALTENGSIDMDHERPPSSSGTSSHSGSVLQIIIVLLQTLAPHLNMASTVTTVYAAMTMRQRCQSSRIVKRISPMVVWIGIDAETYRKHSPVVTRVFRDRHLDKVPNFKMVVPWAGGADDLDYSKADYYVCSHGWDLRNRMWKEAMVATGVLGENVEASMEMLERGRAWWAEVMLVIQGVGYQVSVASRLAQGLEVSPVEVVSAWMSLLVVVEAAIMPLFVIPSKRGICLRLSDSQFHQVAQYYHIHAKRVEDQLDLFTLWCFVLCILFIFFMFLILIPPLVYYYRQLPHSVLSFSSLIPFTVLAGAGIVTFAFNMFLPPQEVLVAFTKHTSKYTFAITLSFMLAGLTCYVLAITETCMHWTRFQAADPSVFRFIIPHVGA